MKKPISIKHPV